MNVTTGEIRPWDSLSEQEKSSGEWIKLPPHNDDGRPALCRRKTMLDELSELSPRKTDDRVADRDAKNLLKLLGGKRGSF